MSELTNKRKSFFFLITVTIFAIFVSVKAKELSPRVFEKQEYILTTEVANSMLINEQDFEGVDRLFFEVDEQLKPVKEVYPKAVLNEGDVLASGTCQIGDIIYSSRKICTRSMGDFTKNMRSSTQVQQGDSININANIYLWEVEVPPLLSGSPVMDSSVRQIHVEDDGTDHWTLRPAGEMINREVVEGNAYPGDEQTKELLDGAQETRNVKFGLQYSIGLAGDAESQDDSDSSFTIDEYHDNDCGEDCRNSPNPTPGNFLVNGNIQAHSENYPTYYEKLDEVNAPEVIDECEESAVFLDMFIDGNTAKACTPSIFQVVVNFFLNILNPSQATDCSPLPPGQVDNRDECVSVADIVVIMESPWGIKRDCTDVVDGKCVTEFNDLRVGGFTPPADKDESQIYVLTDCSIHVDNDAKKVRCAWDIDYISKELDFQAQDNVPNENYPDRMEYLNFHISESENREDPVYEM